MSLARYTVVALLVMLLVPAARGQSPVPAPLNGNQQTPRFSSETELNNVIAVDLGLSSHFDDNVFGTNDHKVSNFIYEFAPRVSWDISRPRWRFSADSLTTLSYSYDVTQLGRFGENLVVSFDFRPVQRLEFRLRNSFNRSSDPFNRYPGSNVPEFSDQPNPSFLGPPTTRTSDQAGADVTYQLGPHTNLGVSGSFSLVQFERLVLVPSFVQPDTYTTMGRAFISHQWSPRHTSSLAYEIQRFTFSNSLGALTHAITYYHTLALTPQMSLSVWGGPEYLHSGATAVVIPPFIFAFPPRGFWSWTAGASYDWTHRNTGVTGSVARQASDGGGFGYVVEMVSGNVDVRQRLGRRWEGAAGVSYNVNHSVSTFGNFATRYFSGNASIKYTFTPHLWMTVDYWRSRQGSAQGPGVLVPGDHNRAAVGIHYTFSRTIGS